MIINAKSVKKMKNLKLLSLVVATILFFSCTKEENPPPTQTPEQILTANSWKIDEIRILDGNAPLYYKRGGSGNTVNYDTEFLLFNTNNTGTYSYNSVQYSTTWNFINAEKTKMTLTINYPNPVVVNLENIVLTSGNFKYTQYQNVNGTNLLAAGTRTPM